MKEEDILFTKEYETDGVEGETIRVVVTYIRISGVMDVEVIGHSRYYNHGMYLTRFPAELREIQP